MTDLLAFACYHTARGLSYGRVYMASKAGYTIVGSYENPAFTIMLLRGSKAIYHEQIRGHTEAAAKMVEVWWALTEKLRRGQPTKAYIRRGRPASNSAS